VTIPRYTDRIVSATYPHKGLADAVGAGLAFWHGVGLTAWFICEGPYSRTDLPGLEKYYSRQLDELREAGCPIHPNLFTELIAAESRLGPPEQILEQTHSVPTSNSPITITMSMSRGTRRKGFQILQEIISRHRRWWTDNYLETYLRYRWEHPLREFAEQYNRDVARTGRVPNRSRLTTLGAPVSNLWFGGDVGMVSSAVGVKAFSPQTLVKLIPDDRFGFVSRVFTELGGQPEEPDDSWKRPEMYHRNWEYRRLAADGLRYVQYEECTGAPPNAAEFHADRYRWPGDPRVGWIAYEQAVSTARLWAASTASYRDSMPPTASSFSQEPEAGVVPTADTGNHRGRSSIWQRLRAGPKG
jgi:hypothetical protein